MDRNLTPSAGASRQSPGGVIANHLCERIEIGDVLALSPESDGAWKACGARVTCDDGLCERSELELETAFGNMPRFDLVDCLGASGRLGLSRAGMLVNAISLRSDFVLFNVDPVMDTRTANQWRDVFAVHGFDAFDCIRPALARQGARKAARHGACLLFANQEGQLRMDGDLLKTRLSGRRALPGTVDLAGRLRRLLPGGNSPAAPAPRAAA